MHYEYLDFIIKAENSAKPLSTPSEEMLSLFHEYISETDLVLDFGCGKLRYTIPLSKIAKNVVGVDSKEQIERTIKISRIPTTLIDFARQYKNIELFSQCNPKWKETTYDKIILSHVLSSIPFEDERIKVIKTLLSVMNKSSILIACTNHRMSYFKKWEQSSKVIKYNDGYLVKEPNASYFGIIGKEKLAAYFSSNGYEILKSYIIEDNSYCICKKRD
jgi:2-polyprenyl-3-methyl-5-hydroxy-6-metoxy-1,4-benzoquinol methylase